MVRAALRVQTTPLQSLGVGEPINSSSVGSGGSAQHAFENSMPQRAEHENDGALRSDVALTTLFTVSLQCV